MDTTGSSLPPRDEQPDEHSDPHAAEQSAQPTEARDDAAAAPGDDSDTQIRPHASAASDADDAATPASAEANTQLDGGAAGDLGAPPPDDAQTDEQIPLVRHDTLAALGGTVPQGAWLGVRAPATRPSEAAHARTGFRRRRRYIVFLRRASRARQAARSLSLARAAWITSAILLLVIVSTVGTSAGFAASYYQSETSAIDGLSRTVASKDSLRIFDVTGKLIYEDSQNGSRHSIPLSKVPVDVINATVAIEDRSFWTNQGVDPSAIVRALLANQQQGATTQGGSTITQQLLKLNVLNSNETLDRKLREAILAVGLTTTGTYSKSQVLTMYLNTIPYADYQADGIDAAARFYFGYEDDPTTGVSAAQHLTLAQASILAGIPQNPNKNSPFNNFKKAHERQLAVLTAMTEEGYITKAQADAAYAESAKPDFFKQTTTKVDLSPHFSRWIIQQVKQMVDAGQVKLGRSGLNVYTTLDVDLQNSTLQAMRDHLYGNEPDDYGGFIKNDNLNNSAALLVDHHTGAIKVMLGSVNYDDLNPKVDGQFNVVTDGKRSAGSSFKPLVYATAFEKGWFPALGISDMPTVFWDEGAGTTYKPLNFNYNQFWGNITLRTALQNSLNIPAVKVMQFAGVDDVRRNAERWGIHYGGKPYNPDVDGRWGLSSVLGTLDVSPYDMTQVYTVFANYGQYIPLHGIESITDSSGSVLFQYKVPQPVQVMSPQIAFLLTSVLTDNHERARDFGPCSPLYLDPDLKGDCEYWKSHSVPGQFDTWPSPNAWPNAAKTGTAQDFTDDWTMGYTTDFTMGVWAGNSDHSPMYHIDGVTGAAPTFHAGMIAAEQKYNKPKTPFPVPSGVHRASYTSNGVTTTDWFLDGPPPPPNISNSGPQTPPCLTFGNGSPGSENWQYCANQPPAAPSPGTNPQADLNLNGAPGGSPPGHRRKH